MNVKHSSNIRADIDVFQSLYVSKRNIPQYSTSSKFSKVVYDEHKVENSRSKTCKKKLVGFQNSYFFFYSTTSQIETWFPLAFPPFCFVCGLSCPASDTQKVFGEPFFTRLLSISYWSFPLHKIFQPLIRIMRTHPPQSY